MSRSSEGQGHDATCRWKGLDLSNNVCKYEVNQLTNEKVIRGKPNFNANCFRLKMHPYRVNLAKYCRHEHFTISDIENSFHTLKGFGMELRHSTMIYILYCSIHSVEVFVNMASQTGF